MGRTSGGADSAEGKHSRGDEDAFLITRAETSLDEQHRARVRKYLFMMSFRVPALVIAGLVYIWTGSPWWAIGIILFSIPLPWVAVIIANDRPPRRRGEVQYYRFGSGRTVGPAELTAEASSSAGNRPGTPPGPLPGTADALGTADEVIDGSIVEPPGPDPAD
ncbi:hypothetical protein GOHSU_37_00310 [Gordonia hirsuta DSM 44140 = NBRC 16056]|uniref:DUF3099 domain-containing protein n=1 Tax=Gordonia hirsuta DSM 44140 = NBRC 16056 TaxID=1121927 RepID=L7LB24_9ACTN|nr:DUF3099 domain-containing protein [Gordonia hirsuta]GAC58335.1 hypothetical protein GOHSU_37_00310 [Gordonia hirsuta DSM 44140 = NBRC 16056]